ncbi:MAG TPA: tetratricopeptide repeat protein [Rhizomicrobium sp.]|nr:tetratricopeptide repeat protein [Rhizomicrobium sp.]
MGSAQLANAYYADGVKLTAAGRHHDAIGKYEQALAADPSDVRVLFALGNTARSLGMAAPAEQFFRQVLTLDPARLEAQINLANLLRAGGQGRAALAVLEPALARNPASPELLLTLGSTHREMGDIETAENLYRQAIEHRSDYPEALGNLADILADRGDVDGALALYDRAIKRDGANAQARLNRAVLNLLKGSLKDGWRDYAARLKVTGKVPNADHRLPRWPGESLKRKRLLITAEQGIGDQIMFASVFADVIARATAEGGSVLIECEPRLVSLFQRSFPQASVYASTIEQRGGIITARYGWLKAAGGANLSIEMGSLPRLFRSDIASFPSPNAFLKPDDAERAHWTAQLGDGPRIGLCWRSGKGGGLRDLQFAPLAQWAAFIRDLPGTLVSTQYDATAAEIAELERLSGRSIVVPAALDQKNEIDRTAAMLSTLDAVISAPTAVSWLAASTGTPVFKLLRDTSWTSFGQSYEPFGPSCVCIGGDTSGDWDSAFAKTGAALRQRLSA